VLKAENEVLKAENEVLKAENEVLKAGGETPKSWSGETRVESEEASEDREELEWTVEELNKKPKPEITELCRSQNVKGGHCGNKSVLIQRLIDHNTKSRHLGTGGGGTEGAVLNLAWQQACGTTEGEDNVRSHCSFLLGRANAERCRGLRKALEDLDAELQALEQATEVPNPSR
jgi:hypothetical protein